MLTRAALLTAALFLPTLAYAEDGKPPDKKTPDRKTPDKKTPDKKTPDKKTPDKKTSDPKKPEKKTGKKDQPGKGKGKGKGKGPDKKKRQIDTKSEDAQMLDDLLHVNPKFGTDKRVELVYDFKQPEQRQDWILRGFRRLDVNGGRMLLGATREGFALHKLPMQGNFVVEVKCRIKASMPSSNLVVLFGNGKSGAVFGNALARRRGRRYKPISRRLRPDKGPFRHGREVKFKYVFEDGVRVEAWVNGAKVASTRQLKNKLDGRVGFLITKNLQFVVLMVSIRGEVDLATLKKKRAKK